MKILSKHWLTCKLIEQTAHDKKTWQTQFIKVAKTTITHKPKLITNPESRSKFSGVPHYNPQNTQFSKINT